ncbi:MAG: heme biosynthesis HemY N-terminal domain-containing protein [Pseudomonadota bacterium]
MLWSLLKVLAFFAAIAGLAWGAGYLLESSGGIMVTVGGTEYPFGPLQSAVALVLLVGLVWLGLKLAALLLVVWHVLNGDETAWTRYRARRKQAKGFDALAEGMMALASGEGRQAMAKAATADKFLDRPELTALLTAQAAEMAGDKAKAEETYRKLVENPQTRFVGVRGILKQKLADGDDETAMKLAEKAFAIKPSHRETGDTLLRLQAQKEAWSAARQTLNTKLKQGDLPRDLHRRRDAVLALCEAKVMMAGGQSKEAQAAAIEANRLSPDLVPAAVMAAQSYAEQGNARAATKVVKKAWEAMPHPDLAAAFAGIAPDESAEARLKRFTTLTRIHADSAETKMLLAELHIAAEDFPGARRALGDMVEKDPTVRSTTLMAAIERGEGADDQVVKAWLARALSAPRDAQWICDICQHISAEWQAICENCGAFDTLSWRRPPAAELQLPGGGEMLPLIVGPSVADTQVVTVADGADNVEDADIIDAPQPEPKSEETAKA